MKHTILIIDDQRVEAEGLCRKITAMRPDFHVEAAYTESDILSQVDNMYYHFAVVDLQMDDYEIDGIDIIKKY